MTTLTLRPSDTTPEAIQRFWSYVERSEGCWIWQGPHTNQGRGQFWINYKSVMAYKYAFLISGGILTPASPYVLHKCHEFGIADNPACCNPSHLKADTAKSNALDCVNAGLHPSQRKTHCKNGHVLAGDNLDQYRLRKGKRRCRTCKNNSQSEYQKERKRAIS